MNREQIEQANKNLPTVPVKGKNYVMVKDRVKAFRMVFPDYSIETEIISLTEDDVTIKATVRDETGRVLSTGHAQESRNASQLNRTSYLENCETSAIGRVLGLCGIGIDDSFGSADEVANAIHQQESAQKPITPREARVIKAMAEEKGVTEAEILKRFGINAIEEMTAEQYVTCSRALSKTQR